MDFREKNEIVDYDLSKYVDDIEEIVVSDYSDEEDKVFNNTPSTSFSNIKILSVSSCNDLNETIDQIAHENGEVEILQSDPIKMPICHRISDNTSDDSAYDSTTDEDSISIAEKKKRRMILSEHFKNLWKEVADEPSEEFQYLRSEILHSAIVTIEKLVGKCRKLECSSEEHIQNNYRLKRKYKRLVKKQKKLLNEQGTSGSETYKKLPKKFRTSI